MRIRTRSWVRVTVSLSVMTAVAGAYLWTARSLARVEQRQEVVRTLVRQCFDLNALTSEFLVLPTERAQEQWRIRYASLRSELDRLAASDGSEPTMDRALIVHRDMGVLFTSLVNATGALKDDADAESDTMRELRRRMAGEVLKQMQVLVGAVTQIGRRIDGEARGLHRDEAGVTSLGVAFLLLALVSSSLWVNRAVLRPIARLCDATRAVGRGNLAYTSPVEAEDEVGDLARAFNLMTGNLKRLTASRDDLEREVDARRVAEQRLGQQMDCFLAILNNIPENLYVADPKTYEILFVNRKLQDALGHDPVGGLCYNELQGESAPCDFCTNARILDHEGPYTWTHEIRRTGRTFRITDQIIKWPDGRDVRFEVAVDTTEMERAQGRLRRALVELARSNADLQEFAYAASHDLQEPLRKVTAFGNRLSEKYGGGLPGEGQDYLARMLNAAVRMQTLIESLLEFSRVATRAKPFEPVDLGETVKGVLSDLDARIQQTGAKITVGSLPTIEAEPVQMRQLMQNLIGNAIKFHKADHAPVVRVRAERNGDSEIGAWVKIEVADEGIGFEPQYTDRIFKVFQRLHALGTYEGSGIGLALCRRIVERHGGSISAAGNPGVGACFTVRLPLQQRAAVVASSDAPEAA